MTLIMTVLSFRVRRIVLGREREGKILRPMIRVGDPGSGKGVAGCLSQEDTTAGSGGLMQDQDGRQGDKKERSLMRFVCCTMAGFVILCH